VLTKIIKDTHYHRPKKDGILFKLYGMFHISCGNFQSCYLKQVYGIVFLQLFEAVTDNLAAYYHEAGGGWGQPYKFNPITAPLVVSVTGKLPILIDAFSKPRILLCRQNKHNVSHSWIFCANVLHKPNLHIFQALFWE
jgi:hypothetical protein